MRRFIIICHQYIQRRINEINKRCYTSSIFRFGWYRFVFSCFSFVRIIFSFASCCKPRRCEVCSVHLAAVGDVLLYGTVFDCLQLIELEEIYHFQGHTRADMVQSLDFFTFLVVKHVCDLKDLCGGRNDRLFSKFEVGIEKCVTCESVLNFL